MKILVVCQHYWPEPFPLTDVCEALVREGHQVHVVTDVPNYPMGYTYPAYKKGKNRKQVHNGVQISRTFTVARRRNMLFRMLNYFSYAISSTLYVLRLKEAYDVVFTNQTSPVLMVSAALAYARKWKKKVVLYCMDLWPASLTAGGIQQSSPVYKLFGWISKKLYCSADKILITSQMFRAYFQQEFGIEDGKIGYLPQYASAGFDAQLPPVEKDTVDFMFAGNVGVAQCIPTILQAAKLLQDNKALRWHIVGDGSELENLQQMAKELGLANVTFHGRKPMEEMPRYYAMADAMLVTLTADPLISMTLPAKVQSYMAAGKPILAAANGEIPHVIGESECGFCAPAEDAQGLAEAVERFLACRDKEQLGKNGRAYYNGHFTQAQFLETLVGQLRDHCVTEEKK